MRVVSYFWKYHASIIGSAIFMISDGWMRAMPTFSQRVEPLTVIPNSSTPTSNSTPATYSGSARCITVCGLSRASSHMMSSDSAV
ncbi:hypothetical protein D3C72_2269980 [compost metagenome]